MDVRFIKLLTACSFQVVKLILRYQLLNALQLWWMKVLACKWPTLMGRLLHHGSWSHPFVPLKYVIGCWTRSRIISVNIKRKYGKSDHGTWGLRKVCIQACILHYRGPMGSLAANVRDRGREMLSLWISTLFSFSFSGQTIQYLRGKEKGRRSNMKKIPKTIIFGHIFLKKSAHRVFRAWLVLLVYVQFTPS